MTSYRSEEDFGFSFISKEDISNETNRDAQIKVDREKERALELYDAIIPFLLKLKSNPDKDTILWPNRVSQVDTFIAKLESILESD